MLRNEVMLLAVTFSISKDRSNEKEKLEKIADFHAKGQKSHERFCQYSGKCLLKVNNV